MSEIIPPERLERNPLITPEGLALFERIRQHPDAPFWTYAVGDRVEARDLPLVEAFRKTLAGRRAPGSPLPGPELLEWIQARKNRISLFRERFPQGFDLERDWVHVPTTGREDAAVRPEDFLSDDQDLSRLIVYDTSGATGHALVVAHHPRAMAMVLPLIEFVLGRYGHTPHFGPRMVASFNVTARSHTVTFPNVFSVWNQAGFAKVNLNSKEWPSRDSARRFFRDLSPFFLAGDPVGLAELIRWDIQANPAVILSTAVALTPGVQKSLEEWFQCPVIDWYSTTETGPVAYTCPRGGLHVLPPDIFVEVLDEDGFPVPPGQEGEITVTGGRNPFFPLLRYRTGDRAKMDVSPCPCGDPTPRLLDLEGRPAVAFMASDGSVVSQADVGLALREFFFLQHQMIQRTDRSIDLRIRPAPGAGVDAQGLERGLKRLLGPQTIIRVVEDPDLGLEGKVIPYKSEMP